MAVDQIKLIYVGFLNCYNSLEKIQHIFINIMIMHSHSIASPNGTSYLIVSFNKMTNLFINMVIYQRNIMEFDKYWMETQLFH